MVDKPMCSECGWTEQQIVDAGQLCGCTIKDKIECAECSGQSGIDEFVKHEKEMLCVGCFDHFTAPTYKTNKHTCQLGDDECYECLQEWRRNRYGDNIHNTDCVCNACRGEEYRGADY
jgi:hypothetical protein